MEGQSEYNVILPSTVNTKSGASEWAADSLLSSSRSTQRRVCERRAGLHMIKTMARMDGYTLCPMTLCQPTNTTSLQLVFNTLPHTFERTSHCESLQLRIEEVPQVLCHREDRDWHGERDKDARGEEGNRMRGRPLGAQLVDAPWQQPKDDGHNTKYPEIAEQTRCHLCALCTHPGHRACCSRCDNKDSVGDARSVPLRRCSISSRRVTTASCTNPVV